MHRIEESIEICSPPEKVMALVSNAETRMRLNPSWMVIDCERLIGRPNADGETCFRFFLYANGRRFKSEIAQVAGKDRVVSTALDGSYQVTLSVKSAGCGTRLRHEEEFALPEEMLEPETRVPDADKFRLFRRILRMFFGFDYYKEEKAAKADQLIASMRACLQAWLGQIKNQIEGENSSFAA